MDAETAVHQQMKLDDVSDAATPSGLTVLGALHSDTSQTVVLLGPNEPKFWSVFTQSSEYLSKGEAPLDRWSERVIGALANQFNAEAVYPFGGPPYQPFIAWALESGRAWLSPVGILVHESSGLFISYRGALIIPALLDLPPASSSPCLECAEKPCLSACPAAALSHDGYDVPKCHAHLDRDGDDCLSSGCIVRRACPIGQNKRLPEQSAFHMRAFHKG
ncbi:MAG: ferredoxin [Paracoccaceae bacterium]